MWSVVNLILLPSRVSQVEERLGQFWDHEKSDSLHSTPRPMTYCPHIRQGTSHFSSSVKWVLTVAEDQMRHWENVLYIVPYWKGRGTNRQPLVVLTTTMQLTRRACWRTPCSRTEVWVLYMHTVLFISPGLSFYTKEFSMSTKWPQATLKYDVTQLYWYTSLGRCLI